MAKDRRAFEIFFFFLIVAIILIFFDALTRSDRPRELGMDDCLDNENELDENGDRIMGCGYLN
jgi:hypothetical protein